MVFPHCLFTCQTALFASCSCFKKPRVGDSLDLVPAAVEQGVMRPQLDTAGSDGGRLPQPSPLPPSYPHHLLSPAGPPRPASSYLISTRSSHFRLGLLQPPEPLWKGS